MKYVFMAEHVGLFKVTTMSRALEVSRSGFYSWCHRRNKPSPQAQRRDHLDEVVKAAFVAGKGRSGSPRLTLDLADVGEVFDRKTVANSQRRQGLRAKAAKKFKATTNSDHSLPVAPYAKQKDFGERAAAVHSIQSQQSAATVKAKATFDALLAQTFNNKGNQ